MGILQRFCKEEKWDNACLALDSMIESLSSLMDSGKWSIKEIDPEDILYALYVLGDDILDAKEHQFYQDLEDCEDDDIPDDSFEFEINDSFDIEIKCECDNCNMQSCEKTVRTSAGNGDFVC